MQKWIPKKNILVSTSLLAGLSLLVYITCLILVLVQIRKLEAHYQNTDSKVAVEKKVSMLETALTKNQANVATIRNFFVQKGDEVSFIEQIEAVGDGVGLKFEIASIDVKPNQVKNLKEDITVRINFEGSWENIMRFVDGLEKMSFGVTILNLDLDTKTKVGWSGSAELVLFREI